MSIRWPVGSVSRLTLQELLEENALLHEENAAFCMERQRGVSPIEVVEKLRATIAEYAGNADEADDLDQATEVFLQAELLRTSLLIACDSLQTALAQVRNQLTLLVPAPELDRRVRTEGDRRARVNHDAREGTQPWISVATSATQHALTSCDDAPPFAGE